MTLINWYKKNKVYANTTLACAGAVGLTASLLCLLFPASLPFLASLSFLGWAPLALLPSLPLLLSSSCVGLLASTFSLMGIALGSAVTKKAMFFAQHSSTLFVDKVKTEPAVSTEESYKKLLQSSLQKCTYRYRTAYRAPDEFVLANHNVSETPHIKECSASVETPILASNTSSLSLSL